MFIIILLEVLSKFNFTSGIYYLDQFIKTLKSQLYKNQVLEQDEEARILAKFLESVKKKQELGNEQITKKLQDEKEFNR